jgi:hypothetical protein
MSSIGAIVPAMRSRDGSEDGNLPKKLSSVVEGTAVILSSHLLELIEELSARLMILDRGRKVFDGTLGEARASLAPREGSTLEEIYMAATGAGDQVEAAGPDSRAPVEGLDGAPPGGGSDADRGGS